MYQLPIPSREKTKLPTLKYFGNSSECIQLAMQASPYFLVVVVFFLLFLFSIQTIHATAHNLMSAIKT